MTKEETFKLFNLLEQFYPNAKQVKSNDTKIAWSMALEKFTYKDVKNAAIDYALGGQYFPNLSDITARIKPTLNTTTNTYRDKYGTLREAQEKLEKLRAELKRIGVITNDS